jgi:lipase
VTLALHEFGPPGAPRVVCLHGVRNHGRHFERLAAALGEYRVLAPDLLGHGNSSWEPPWDIGAHCDAIVETVGAREAILVGHSFGGMIAQKLLGQDRALAAVAIDAAQIKGVLRSHCPRCGPPCRG